MADYERNNRRLLRDFQTEDEEYATEVAPARIRNERREGDGTAGGTIIGFISLALAVLSFFTYPVIFGIGAVLLGMYARARGAQKTGTFAIILGAIAAVLALVFRVALATFFLALF